MYVVFVWLFHVILFHSFYLIIVYNWFCLNNFQWSCPLKTSESWSCVFKMQQLAHPTAIFQSLKVVVWHFWKYTYLLSFLVRVKCKDQYHLIPVILNIKLQFHLYKIVLVLSAEAVTSWLHLVPVRQPARTPETVPVCHLFL